MTYDPEAAERVAANLEASVRRITGIPDLRSDEADLIRAQAAEIERLKATHTPGHTDMMVSPESLDSWLEDNPLPAPQPDADRETELDASLIKSITAHAQTIAQRNALAAEIERQREAHIRTAASLAAAISLLERGGKKAAPSDRMFNQMLEDYRASLLAARTALGGKP